jgi:hypothetical protein
MPLCLLAQDLTGKWIGYMSGNQYLELNIKQKGDKIKGQSFDSVKGDLDNYCRARFMGNYNYSKKMLSIEGYDFIEYSSYFDVFTGLYRPSHSLMKMKLYYRDEGEYEILEGTVGQPFKLSNPIASLMTGDVIVKRKKTVTDSVSNKTDSTVLQKLDTIKQVKEENVLTKAFNSREKIVIKSIKVKNRKLQIKIIDNEIYDADTISLFVNEQPVLLKQEINYKPIELELLIPEDQHSIELGFFADNLGKIPPNTAVMTIISGKDRFEIHASADLNKNAIINITLDP